ncbi:hypothetical protein P8452_38926 [Trifolium repens]|nr:hypothetical protein P8452_38926 [Trifolium repens]
MFLSNLQANVCLTIWSIYRVILGFLLVVVLLTHGRGGTHSKRNRSAEKFAIHVKGLCQWEVVVYTSL